MKFRGGVARAILTGKNGILHDSIDLGLPLHTFESQTAVRNWHPLF